MSNVLQEQPAQRAPKQRVVDYDRWLRQLPELKSSYQEATPFPHVVSDNFLEVPVVEHSVGFFTTLQYNGSGLQNHKFIVAQMLFCPLSLVAWLIPRPGMRLHYAGIPELGMALAVFLGAASGVDWLGGIANSDCRTGDMSLSFYDTDCRADVGAGLSEPTRPMYFDPAIEYLYIGCRPAFMVGPSSSMDGHDIKAGKAALGIGALREFSRESRFQPLNADTTVAFARGVSTDPACRLLQKTPGACKPSGTMVEICSMTPAQRDAVLN